MGQWCGKGADASPSRRDVDGDIRILIEELEQCIARSAPRDALALLNACSRYRFTGLYRFEPPFFRSIALFDRENPAIHLCGDITVMPNGNGSITRSTGNGENNDLAAPDERLRACLAAQRIKSYSGIALRNGNATVWGVLCHFDLRPRASVHSHSRVFAAVAGLLGEAIVGT